MLTPEAIKFLRDGQNRVLSQLALKYGHKSMVAWVKSQRPKNLLEGALRACPKAMRKLPVYKNIRANMAEAEQIIADATNAKINPIHEQN